MATIINSRLGQSRGVPRVWMEGQKLARENINVGDKYDIEIHNSKFVLRFNEHGKYTVSKRTKNGYTLPLIEVRTEELSEVFKGIETLRIAIHNGRIVVSAHHMQQEVIERVERLVSRVKAKKPLRTCSLFHGGGGLDKSIHHGMAHAGVKSKIAIVVELESKYLESSLRNNTELFDQSSLIINSDIRLLNMSNKVPKADILIAGVPCDAASVSGRSKNKTWKPKLDDSVENQPQSGALFNHTWGLKHGGHAESHSRSGALFYQMLQMVYLVQAPIIILENVCPYADTASADIIRSTLASWGYVVLEGELDGTDFGSLEKRKRWALVAVSEGLDMLFEDLGSKVVPLRKKPEKIADILEPIADDDSRWKSFDYLDKKALRDKAKGNSFQRQVLTGSESYCGTLGKGYAKCRSTEPFLEHPVTKLQRIFTAVEHCRIKGFDESFIAGNSETVAHEILGQSVCYAVFESLGYAIGKCLMQNMQLELPVAA